MSIFETSRRMTAREQAAYDLGFHEGKNSAIQHGRWEWDNRFHDYTCSECRNWDLKTPNYCSNCGARMDGE